MSQTLHANHYTTLRCCYQLLYHTLLASATVASGDTYDDLRIEVVDPAHRVAAFEDGSSIYLAPVTYGEMILKDPGDQAGGKDCVRINNKLSTIRKNIKDPLLYSYGWRMVADESVSNDEQLLAFVALEEIE